MNLALTLHDVMLRSEKIVFIEDHENPRQMPLVLRTLYGDFSIYLGDADMYVEDEKVIVDMSKLNIRAIELVSD